jgi:DNA-binding transcriptional ArsR family regulator
VEIIFNPKAGEICGLFSSLHLAWNINKLENHLQMFGLSLKGELKDEYHYINEIHSGKKEQMDFFFSIESKIYRCFMIFEKIWECSSVAEYVGFIQNMDYGSIIAMLVKTLIDDKFKNDDEYIKGISNNKEEVLSFIQELDISKAAKWDIYCFTGNVERYKHEFIALLEEYLPAYNEITSRHISFMDDLSENIVNRVNVEGIEFIKEYTNNLISLDIEAYKKIYLTSSYFDSYLIYFTLRQNTQHCYLIVGAYYQETVNQSDYIETHLKVLKNLCDKTRFGIMKYILDCERYGQEISQKFNISNASVSYHMNNLLMLNLVQISKRDNKVFYKLNKNKISETIRFLQDELHL